MAQLILVSAWAAKLFPEWKPHPNTLRNWVHNGKIGPHPRRLGTSIFATQRRNTSI